MESENNLYISSKNELEMDNRLEKWQRRPAHVIERGPKISPSVEIKRMVSYLGLSKDIEMEALKRISKIFKKKLPLSLESICAVILLYICKEKGQFITEKSVCEASGITLKDLSSAKLITKI